MTAETVSGRSCGTCTLCCHLPEIDVLSKPANAMCSNCIEGKGCTIYPDRPSLCRDFHCLWTRDGRLGDEWNPARSHMMLYEQGPQTTVLVDPDFPEIWKQEPYLTQMRRWAAEGKAVGRYVIVFVGDQVTKIG
ncbi:hypothetical protein MRS76_21250 [Rhizobiaceae bacterium n13]|uniref:Zinc/iron-chelating domain-containing protein n=1 Tax=Ferirhizobium litorale TaxID=2927786 RepID=A0AAE3QKC8_9HYPH|nr:hypothetical protein [Fererhizobium litorale]MDI7864465.1 hypothetical protein [Fererhizobium litorale]MDI7924784.1 hypothetical protein [Fererhizobium litorale]